MKKIILYTVSVLILLSGCTQIVTAPISIAGATASAAIDVAGSTIRAVTPNSDK